MERIGDSVGRELARSGGDAGAALAEITAVWPQAVGEAVSRQAWPLRVARDGTLHVATASSTWAFELDRLSPEIHQRLTALAGDSAPTKLRFRVGPIPEPAALPVASEEAPQRPFEASPETASEAAELVAEIADPELRQIVARAARASLSRARSGRQI
jgi:hypothetical protein